MTSKEVVGVGKESCVSGLILTGGIKPHDTVLRLIRRTDIPVILVENDTYHNPWLGFSITKPSSFQFSGFDLMWPATTVVAMDGPERQRVEVASLSASLPTARFDGEKLLREKGFDGARSDGVLAGRETVSMTSDQKAGTVLVDHANVWLITTQGPHAGRLLAQVVSSVVLEN